MQLAIEDKSTDSKVGKIVIYGYFRFIENTILNIIIPDNVKNIIMLYIKVHLIFGSDQQQKKWIRLYRIESFIIDNKQIYPNGYSLSVITKKNKMYSVGYNGSKRLGINSTSENITEWTAIPINNIKIASIGISNYYHTFILTLNNDLYGSGSNDVGQFGNGKPNEIDNTLLKINTSKWLLKNEIIFA